MSVDQISIPGLNISAFVKLVQVPYDTQSVFEMLGTIIRSENHAELAQSYTMATSKDEGLQALYRERFAPRYPTNDELIKNPEGSLGRVLGEHMIRNHITLDFQGLDTSTLDDNGTRFETYVWQRGLRVHDILHVMLNADTSPLGEGLVAGFQSVQYSAVIHQLISCFMGMHIAFYQGHQHHDWILQLNEAMNAGRKATPFYGVPWERYMSENIDTLRERFNITKLNSR